jgi:hypothetical protein
MYLIKRIIFLLAIVFLTNIFVSQTYSCDTDTECEAQEALKCWILCQR